MSLHMHIAPELIIDGTLYTLLIFSVITWTLIFLNSGSLSTTVVAMSALKARFGVCLI